MHPKCRSRIFASSSLPHPSLSARPASSRRRRRRKEHSLSSQARFRSEEGGADSEARHLRPGEDAGAIRISPAITTTATRAAFRSSGLTNTPAARSTSRRRNSQMVAQRQQQTIERTPGPERVPGATSPMHWFENYYAATADPGWSPVRRTAKCPLRQPEARQRQAARQAARKGRGPADSWEDRSLYDRCITRGIPGSMMPGFTATRTHPSGSGIRDDHA